MGHTMTMHIPTKVSVEKPQHDPEKGSYGQTKNFYADRRFGKST